MSSLTDSSGIFRYHRDMINHHGASSSYALGWRDAESQQVRFKALAGIADLNHHSILDAGCGYGDLLPHLQNLYPQLRHYCGIEQIPELLDEATRRHHSNPVATFISGNFMARRLPVMDYIFASGSLNYASADPGFIFKAIEKLYSSCIKGLAFNLLRSVPSEGLLVCYDPKQIVVFCRTLSEDVILIDDYAEEDFTVWMRKGFEGNNK